MSVCLGPVAPKLLLRGCHTASNVSLEAERRVFQSLADSCLLWKLQDRTSPGWLWVSGLFKSPSNSHLVLQSPGLGPSALYCQQPLRTTCPASYKHSYLNKVLLAPLVLRTLERHYSHWYSTEEDKQLALNWLGSQSWDILLGRVKKLPPELCWGFNTAA